tara:strand:+ start:69 stop:1343 length:1275 start_codon:yes stop_codon:yes gene_type:complete
MVEAMRIDSAGNVGVGGPPTSLLTVRDDNLFGGADNQIVAQFSPSVTLNEHAGIAFGTFGGSDDYLKTGIFWKRTGSYGVGDLIFANNGAADVSTVSSTNACLTISSTGNVTAQGGFVGVKPTSGANTGIQSELRLFGHESVAARYASISCTNTGGTDQNALTFFTNSGSTQTEQLRLDEGGLATFTGAVSAPTVQVGSVPSVVGGFSMTGLASFQRNGAVMSVFNDTTGSGTAQYCSFRYDGSEKGSISSAGTSTTYATSSDYRLKENVTPITGALDRLDLIPAYKFNFISNPSKTVDGFLAHEVAEFVPEAVVGTKDGMQTVVTVEAADAVEAVEAVEAIAAVDATYYAEGDELPEGVAVGDEKTAAVEAVLAVEAVEAVEAVAEVTEEQPKYQGIDQSKLVPLLVAAVKELKAKVTALENA